MEKVYFKGLNGIRAIAAFIVIFFHIDQFSPLFSLKEIGYHKTGMAAYGVVLFFVLSGFLITYLLLKEKNEFTKIDMPKFYLRRILRIWPIYYLIILIAVLFVVFNWIVPEPSKFSLTIGLYSLLLANVGYSLGLGLITITPLWSVGVEEQFYAFWPFLINKSKRIFRSLLFVCGIYIIVKIFLRVFENNTFYYLISVTSFDSMAIGGIAAYFLFTKNRILEIFYHPLLQLVAWGFLIVSIFYKPVHISSLFDTEMHAFFYSLIIINVSTNKNTLVNLENKVLNFLGRISYGLYVYHMTVILLLSYFLKDKLVQVNNLLLKYLIVYFLTIFFTIFIAFISYEYFEKIFLKYKRKYSKIQSTN